MLLAALYFCIFLSAFNLTTSIMGGPYIVGELGGSFDIAVYGVVFFGLGSALTFPIASRLGKRFGKSLTLRTGLVILSLCFLLCSFSETFFLFVLMRFFSGIVAGVFYPLALDLINETLPQNKEDLSFAFLAFVMTITPVIGASFGGWIAYEYHWSWIFTLQIPACAFCFLVLWLHSSRHSETTLKQPFDSVGYLFYTLTAVSFIMAICLGQELDWFRSSFITFLVLFSCASLGFFIIWELTHKDPFIHIKLFKIPAFLFSVFVDFFLFSTYFGIIITLSLWLQVDANYTPLWISLLLLHMIFVGVLLFVFMVKWMKKISPFPAIFFSVAAFAISCFYSTTFNAETDFTRIAISRVLAGFGVAFFLYPLYSICLNSLSNEEKPQGVIVFQTCRLLGGATGLSLYPTIWLRRQAFYHDRLGSSLTEYSERTNQFFSDVSFFGFEGTRAHLALEKALESQSTVLALADTSYLMAWIMVCLLVITAVFWIRTKAIRNG